MGDFDGFLPFDLPRPSNKTLAIATAVIIVLAAAFYWDYFVPHGGAPCESDANCTPKNSSEIKVGVSYLCVNKTCVEKPFGNPASEKCEADGGTVRMQENENGTQGICVLPDGAECDEWEYYRGECGS